VSDGNPELLASLMRIAEGCSVLYVEDEAAIRNEIAEMLETLFTRVVQAENGAEGLERYQKEPFQLVITDINMPVMTGIELIQAIRVIRPQQAFLVTSAYSDAANLIPLINLGVGSFALKPLNWKVFLGLVYRELSAARAAHQEVLYQQRLEKEVRIRTEELRETQQHVVRLQEAKDNMLALISHELRTPLNGILGFVELIRGSTTDPDALVFLAHVEDSARRIERSTRKALDFANLSTGKRPLNRELHRVEDLILAAQDQVSDRLDPLDHLAVRWEGNDPEGLFTDGELVVEILKNLLENSAKYAGSESMVRITFHREGNWDVLTVRDSGPGFPAALLNTLFQPFSTGNIMHHSEGMGLGLALVDVIMLTVGGRVEAVNDGGAVVRLRFPLTKRT
jgi:two-component system sensor histidine kinase/response regulator